jgi:hypothetical protein
MQLGVDDHADTPLPSIVVGSLAVFGPLVVRGASTDRVLPWSALPCSAGRALASLAIPALVIPASVLVLGMGMTFTNSREGPCRNAAAPPSPVGCRAGLSLQPSGENAPDGAIGRVADGTGLGAGGLQTCRPVLVGQAEHALVGVRIRNAIFSGG